MRVLSAFGTVALLIAATAGAQAPTPTFPAPVLQERPDPGTPREVPVFWLIGQSNAVGPVSGFWLSNPLNAGGRYYHLHSQLDLNIWWRGHSSQRPMSRPGWESYRTGFFLPLNNATYDIAEGACGPESSFGGAAVQALGEPVYVFKFTGIIALHPDAPQTFSKREGRETFYDAMIAEWQLASERLRARNLVPRVHGILWVHGEADFVPGYAESYGQNLARFVTDVRADILRLWPDNGPVRFVIAEMHDRHVPASGFDRNEALIRAGQLHVVRTVPNCALVDVDDLPLDTSSPFHVHFDPIGIMTLGERLFAAWRDEERDR